ncbi:MAG TPA: hypothetical protein VFP72_18850 [Kineosporiaceae bacterium]|nr:hypothetical protein [Kineosporiaceae bacterium]
MNDNRRTAAADDDGPAGAASVVVHDALGTVVGPNATVTNIFGNRGRIARSAYLEQVRDIAPADLIGRGTELAELEDFCRNDEAYMWWQAGPWAGKTALMSWFVLHPPDDVDVVCFFITARLSAQADSAAFTEAILEQLASLLGEDLPRSAAGGARDAHRRSAVHRAAERAQKVGRRLVMVIDGLDEDRGVDAGMPSIASLLPKQPYPGLKIILAGRPHPPIPTDVDGTHPLRTCRVKPLPASNHAGQIQELAQRELGSLLVGPGHQRDLVGIICAAGGGLTGADLQRLTGLHPFELHHLLEGVTGRTISARAGTGQDLTEDGPVYLLAHEELQLAAVEEIGADLLDRYREKIHSWAAFFADMRWPRETPPYLFRGYARMLQTIGDVERLARLAADPVRHDRMLDHTGGDATSYSEISAAMSLAADLPDPRILPMCRVSAHRRDLDQRNASIPHRLPSVWLRLNNPLRAEALAKSISDPARRTQALVTLSYEFLTSGRGQDARALAVEGASAVTQIPDPQARALAFLELALLQASLGEREASDACANGAGDSAMLVADVEARVQLLARMPFIARDLSAGAFSRNVAMMALLLVQALDSSSRAKPATLLSTTLMNGVTASRGRQEFAHAAQFAGIALQALLQIPGTLEQQEELLALAKASGDIAKRLVDEGELATARLYSDNAAAATSSARKLATGDWAVDLRKASLELTLSGDPSDYQRDADVINQLKKASQEREQQAVAELTQVLASVGDYPQAITLTTAIASPRMRVECTCKIAASMSLHEYPAEQALGTAENWAGEIEDDQDRLHSNLALLEAHLRIGNLDEASRLGRAILFDLDGADLEPRQKARLYVSLITAFAGHPAEELSDLAEASAVASLRELESTDEQVQSLDALIRASAGRELKPIYRLLAEDILQTIPDITHSSSRLAALLSLTGALGDDGADLISDDLLYRAAQDVHEHLNPRYAGETLTDAVKSLRTMGRLDLARRLGEVCAPLAKQLAQDLQPHTQASILSGWMSRLAVELHELGDPGEAIAVALRIHAPSERLTTLVQLARMAARSDDGATLATVVTQLLTERDAPAFTVDPVLQELAEILAEAGQADDATAVVEHIADAAVQQRALLGMSRSFMQSAAAAPLRTSAALLVQSLLSQPAGGIGESAVTGTFIGDLVSSGYIEIAVSFTQDLCRLESGSASLTFLVDALLKASRIPEAAAVIRTMGDLVARVEALAATAYAACDVDQPGVARDLALEAESVARSVVDPRIHDESFAAVITGTCTIGRLDLARRALSALKGDKARETATKELDRAVRRALHTSPKVPDAHSERRARSWAMPFLQSLDLIELARAFETVGNKRESRRLVRDAEARARWVAGPYNRLWALCEVSLALAAGGHPEAARADAFEAERQLAEITTRHMRCRAISRLALAFSSADQTERVRLYVGELLELLPGLPDPAMRAAIMASATPALARIGDREHARRLLAECLLIAPWPVSVSGIALVETDDFTTFAEEQLSPTPPRDLAFHS